MIRIAFYFQILCAIVMVINVCVTGANDYSHLWILGKIAAILFLATFGFEIVIEVVGLIKKK